jgi:CheY-like chemotaxis protein
MSAKDFDSRILLVDDNVGDAFLLEFALREAGAKGPIQAVANYDQAVDWLDSAQRPSSKDSLVVVVNTHGSNVEVLKVLAWLREHAEFREVFTAVLADNESEALMQHAFRLGANMHLVKPTSIPELSGILWCAQTAAIREPSRSESSSVEPEYSIFGYSPVPAY